MYVMHILHTVGLAHNNALVLCVCVHYILCVCMLQLKSGCPGLGDVSEVAVEIITQTGPSPTPQEERDHNQVIIINSNS